MRQIVNINSNWAFAKQISTVPAVIDEQWESVNLPHSWNAIDGQDGNNDYFRGDCMYVKTVSKADLPAAERYFLEIRGANSSAEVFVGGESLAVHHGGYSTWRVDLTDKLAEETQIAIRVNNAANETVYPQMADFTFYGGIYRDVNIVCVPESHFDLSYYGGPGIQVTPVMNGDNAEVTVETWITNAKAGQEISYTITDREGAMIAQTVTADTKVSFTIENAHKWNGRKDPYLYTVQAALLENGSAIDNVSARFGCRSFAIDPAKGCILNGESYPLRGVSRHQDRWGFGNALLPEHHEEDIDLICEVGCTSPGATVGCLFRKSPTVWAGAR